MDRFIEWYLDDDLRDGVDSGSTWFNSRLNVVHVIAST